MHSKIDHRTPRARENSQKPLCPCSMVLPGAREGRAKPQPCLLSSEQPGLSQPWRCSHSRAQRARAPGAAGAAMVSGSHTGTPQLHRPELAPQDGNVRSVREGLWNSVFSLGKSAGIHQSFKIYDLKVAKGPGPEQMLHD